MKFTKEFLFEAMDNPVEDKIVGKSRWANVHRMVFEHDGAFYAVQYRHGTGDEGEVPFQELKDEDLIDCPEVFANEKTIVVYEVRR